MDASDRLWSKVDKTGACWVWQGSVFGKGYGVFTFEGRRYIVHRLSYELVNGPIPDGLVIDHLCRNQLCVRPDHLEAVTHRVNILRGIGYTAVAARKTHCKRGHEFTPENTVKSTNGRWCRECKRAWHREYNRRKRQETATEQTLGTVVTP